MEYYNGSYDETKDPRVTDRKNSLLISLCLSLFSSLLRRFVKILDDFLRMLPNFSFHREYEENGTKCMISEATLSKLDF